MLESHRGKATRKLDSERIRILKAWSSKNRLDFKDLTLLDQALTHSSFSNEVKSGLPDNQRLEYLGDSVLGLAVNNYLYHKYPDFTEGYLARIKSSLVSEVALARAARSIELGHVLNLGRGEKNSGGMNKPSCIADAMEAVFAAIYLDRGFSTAEKFVLHVLKDQLLEVEGPERATDAKSILQEIIQKKRRMPPQYELVSESGPDHKKTFFCRVTVDGKELGSGKGSSRKRAEQVAAQNALDRLKK